MSTIHKNMLFPTGFTNAVQAILSLATFLLIAVQGYLATSPLVAGHQYVQIFIVFLPGLIALGKVLVGSSQPGTLTPTQARAIQISALILTASGFAISAYTSDPNALLIAGVISAIAMALKNYIGVSPPPPLH